MLTTPLQQAAYNLTLTFAPLQNEWGYAQDHPEVNGTQV
jgi:hypothetical protein